ncbi:hypothetical protein [Rubrivirga sp. IMCC43871]|uniref:hypothetical protein n=1 Tax=Rubrivirga sp. IMCC43871 TaxID=3391575 RepID=UPI003990278F
MDRTDRQRPAALRPLDALPPALRDALDDDGRRDVADLGADLQRAHRARLRIGLPGGADCPPFLQAAEADAPGAARLYVALDGLRFTAEGALDVGARVELEPDAVAAALSALRRAELVADGSERMRTVPPASVPF